MLRRALLCALTLTLVTAAPALASPQFDHNHRHHDSSDWAGNRGNTWGDSQYEDGNEDDSGGDSNGSDEDDSDTPTSDTGDSPVGVEAGVQASLGGTGTGKVLTGAAKTVSASLTGYSRADNNPPGSAEICCGVIHSVASGTGTAADPITAASAGSGAGIEVKAGTVVYIGKLRKYFIIEDSGATATGKFRMDLWVDGKGFPNSAAEACMSTVTGDAQVIVNPPKNLPVGKIGPLTGPSGCNI
jgi:hypothetical protein